MLQKAEITQVAILKDYLDQNGLVNYKALKDDLWLRTAIQRIENEDLSKLNHAEEFAFWLNAYNIITLKAVYQELEKNPFWKGNTTYWKRVKFFFLKKHIIGQKKISLYTLENKIIRS
ncbi:MAG: DUF547 domain-containing protein, partial [Candidatus Hodarchaeales archaeon]